MSHGAADSCANDTIAAQRVDEFIHALASKQPAPGGGAASAMALAHGAALGCMVLEYTIGKHKFASHDAEHRALLDHLKRASREALAHADADAVAYAGLNALWSIPTAERPGDPRWGPAVEAATGAPASTGALALGVLAILARLPGTTSALMRSDLAIAAEFARVAAVGAQWNVRANLPLHSAEPRARWEQWCDVTVRQADDLCSRVTAACRA